MTEIFNCKKAGLLFFLVSLFGSIAQADLYTKTYQDLMASYGVKAIPRSAIVNIPRDVAAFYELPENMQFVVKWWEYELIDGNTPMTKPVHAYFHGWHSTPACFSPKKIRMRLDNGRPQINFAQIGHGLGEENQITTRGFRSYAMINGRKLDPEKYNLKVMNAGLIAFYRHAELLYGPMTTEGHSNGGMQTHAANASHEQTIDVNLSGGGMHQPSEFAGGFIKPLKMIIDGRPPYFQMQSQRLDGFVQMAQTAKTFAEAFEKHVIARIPLPITRYLLRTYIRTITQGFTWAMDLVDFEKNGEAILERFRQRQYVGGEVPEKSVRYNWLSKQIFYHLAKRFPLALAGSITPIGIDIDFLEHILRQKDYEWGSQKLTSDALVIVGNDDPIGARAVMENALEIGSEVELVRAIIIGAGHLSELSDEFVEARLKVEEAFLDGNLTRSKRSKPIEIRGEPLINALFRPTQIAGRLSMMACEAVFGFFAPANAR